MRFVAPIICLAFSILLSFWNFRNIGFVTEKGVVRLIVEIFASFVILKFDVLLDLCDQRNHRITTQMQRRIYGHATDVEIRPLDEEKAVQAAVDLIGEIFLFGVTLFTQHSLGSEFYCFR